ncbi:hypothetical protein E1B28_012399 [Marasmius oreades]|uniref:Uncharacterized protein n=1 Tax=Marasmius oreades TaxID=181124 RepID=A0A9P7RSF3_9AGAR|nr:uncharacterized protein E1B28_012399 [Marasmius oreades]KAG7088401.1 hypothetical protein E1B28_012399 [Marasmius oreades]
MNNSNDPVSPSLLPARISPRSTRSRAGSSAKSELREHNELNEFCLLVAGDHGGKSSFLRLLLETSTLAGTQELEQQNQKSHMRNFIQGCASRTTAIRYTTLDVLVPPTSSPRTSPKSSPKSEVQQVDQKKNADNQVPLTFTLIDTPSINPPSPSAPISSSASIPDDLLRLVESRLAEAVDTSSRTGLMHLCIYFLDPVHAYSLPRHHIDTICRLSARVNVLPVIAKADRLTDQQLRVMKEVVRRDLADAGIGFGIFDQEPATNKGTEAELQLNGKFEQKDSPEPTSKIPSLPFALISPDCYDILNSLPPSVTSSPPLPGSPRNRPSSPNQDAAPSGTSNPSFPSRFTRAYRWGSIDVLNPDHSDFLVLKQAVFHHMHTLRQYTKDYLLEKFKTDYLGVYRYPPHPHSREAPSHSHHPRDLHLSSTSSPYAHNLQHGYIPPHPSQQDQHSYSHSRSSSGSARPVLAIDTGSSGSTPMHRLVHEHAVSTSASSRTTSSRQPHHLPAPSQPVPEPTPSGRGVSKKDVAEGEKEKTRPKKITVACNFCRSRKLKCDGVRPACVQCLKRSNPCDYQTQGRRRGAKGKRDKVGASEKEAGKEKDKEETRPTNANGSSSGSIRGSRRGKVSGSREDSEDADHDGDNGDGEGSRTGSQDAECEDEDDGDVEMADPAGMSPRSPAVRRSRDGSLNEYPPPHLSQPPQYHRPSSSSSSNHFAQSHPTLPSISAEFPPPHTHTTRSRAPSISSITGPPDREQRERGGYELPHIATLSLPDPTARSTRHSPHLTPSQHGHHTRSSSSSQHHLHPGAHLPLPHAHPQHTRSPPHHLPPPHLPSPHPHQSQQHHLSASSTPSSHISPHQSSSSAASSHLSPHHQHHRLPSPHQPPQHTSQLHAHATSRKRAATAPSKSSGPIDVGTSLPPPVPGPARPSEVSRGRSSTTSGLSDQGALVAGSGNNAPSGESLGVGGSAVNVGTIGSVTAGMIRATGRLTNTSGPKIVACNFCRARKTKCDGAHPSCGSCARRNLPCNYVHERGGRRGGGAAAVAAASSAQAQASLNTGPGVSTGGGGDKKPPSRGNKRMSDAEEEGGSGRKRMRVSDG